MAVRFQRLEFRQAKVVMSAAMRQKENWNMRKIGMSGSSSKWHARNPQSARGFRSLERWGVENSRTIPVFSCLPDGHWSNQGHFVTIVPFGINGDTLIHVSLRIAPAADLILNDGPKDVSFHGSAWSWPMGQGKGRWS